MARILLGWELGEGLGHVATLLPVAQALAQYGHEPILVLHNIVETWPLLRNSGFTVLQAPEFFARSGDENTVHHTRSYADILAHFGYDDADTLEPVVRAWRNLLDSVKPDLVVAEHAPTLSLASYKRVPLINLGTGFEIAHWDHDHFLVLNEKARERITLEKLNLNIETVLRRVGQTSPEPAIAAVLGEQSFVAVFSDVDPYRETREEAPCGPLWSLPAVIPPLPASPMCLVYLPADHPELEKLMRGLVNLTMPGMVYVRNASAHVLNQLRATSLAVYTSPIDLDAAMPRVSVVLHHGGAGMTQRCLAYGRPQVIAPIHLEQQLTCTALQEMGVAIKLGGIFSVEQSGAAMEQAINVPRLAQLAQHHARALKLRYPQGSLDRVVKACLSKLPLLTDGHHVSVTFVTTCKGRLQHLQQTLPLMVAEQPDEIIVVDYACPQGTGDWVETNFPRNQFPFIKVVRVMDDPGFSASRARNIGATVATSNWLCFIDADICVQSGWVKWMRSSLNDIHACYLSPVHQFWSEQFQDTYGTAIVPRSTFVDIGGYDEVFRSWGGEDSEMYFRLRSKGIALKYFPQVFIRGIPHSDQERLQFSIEKDITASHLATEYYRSAKIALMRLEGSDLPLKSREELMRAAVEQTHQLRKNPAKDQKIITEFLLDGKFQGLKGGGYRIEQKVVTAIKKIIINQEEGSPGKKFCVMTEGRSGSTSLMKCLGWHDDIAVPSKNIECYSDELLHEEFIDRYMAEYGRLSGAEVVGVSALIESFYAVNAQYGYAGFKSMHNRDPNFNTFINRNDIQFITLIRQDVTSSVASFMLGKATGVWARQGEQQVVWRFDEARHGNQVKHDLAFVLQSHARLRDIPNAITLTYEDLCNPDFKNEALNNYFARAIYLNNPRPPTQGSSYVENWEEFEAFIARARKQIELEI